jgi:hypothetical protein
MSSAIYEYYCLALYNCRHNGEVTNKMQQFPFIDLFKSALHVSGDVFAHPQEKFNGIYSFDTMHRPAADRSAAGRCIVCTKAVYTVKLLLRMSENIARNM